LAEKFESENESAGVVVGVATEVVNNGERFPAEKLLTVPPPEPPQPVDHCTIPANQQNACVEGPLVGGAIEAGGIKLGGGVGTVRT
jgi:hypothetical protein